MADSAIEVPTERHCPCSGTNSCGQCGESSELPASVPVETRVCEVECFHFFDPANVCDYWAKGEHILVRGKCRCGAQYTLTQNPEKAPRSI